MHANVGIFSLSYAALPLFLVSVLFIDPYFILKFYKFLIWYNIISLMSDEWNDNTKVRESNTSWYVTKICAPLIAYYFL